MNRSFTTLLAIVFTPLLLQAEQSKSSEPASATNKDGVEHLDAAAAKKLIDATADKKNAKFVVLDIRTPDEFAEGHIEGAQNVDFLGGKFAEEIAKLDKSKTYLVHCRSGGRSGKSLETFKKLGFKSVKHLDGGIADWIKAKYPVVK